MLGYLELDMEVSDTSMETTEFNNVERCQEITEMPIVCWLQYEKEQDFPTKMDESLSTHLSSQLVDCIR